MALGKFRSTLPLLLILVLFAPGSPMSAQLAPVDEAVLLQAPSVEDVGRRSCFEMSDSVAAFSVRECLTLTAVSRGAQRSSAVWPERMREVIASELVWRSDLLPDFSRSGTSVGTLSREARVGAEAARSMGDHGFVLTVTSGADSSTLDLGLTGHQIDRIVGYALPDGSGFVRIYEQGGEAPRVVWFSEGQVLDQGVAAPSVEKSTAFSMGCYIDTPAFDQFTSPSCYRFTFFNWDPSVAVFQVFLPYTPQSVVWSQPNSSCSGLQCAVPISPGQSISGYAYWVINGIPTGPVSARAWYLIDQ